jgi:polygalacturonase
MTVEPSVTTLLVTPRSATFEVRNAHAYRAPTPHQVWIAGQCVLETHRNVLTVWGLSPARLYEVRVLTEGREFALSVYTEKETAYLDAREFGARGDGAHDDTSALQAMLSVCPVGGTASLPAGTWLSGPLFLPSGINLELRADARLLGHDRIEAWPVLPAKFVSREHGTTRVLGTWEGRAAPMHAALLNLIEARDVRVFGPGRIEGGARADTWWSRPKAPFGGWRPRTVYLAHAQDVALCGLSLRDSPSWTVHALECQDLRVLDVDIESPIDSPNTDGINPESCERVLIAGARISTGDDCIALKSGMPGEDPRPPTRDVEIGNCLLEHGHGAIVLGSECAGGIVDVLARDCRMERTDRGLRIKTRRDRGPRARIDRVRLRDCVMTGVGTPIAINALYDGGGVDPPPMAPLTGAAATRMPSIGLVQVERVVCDDTRHCAVYALGFPENPVEELRIDRLRVRFADDATPGAPDMAPGMPLMCRAGLHVMHVARQHLTEIDIDGEDATTSAPGAPA